MWHRFKLNQREFEWTITDKPSRCLYVRSIDGDYHVQSLIHENENPISVTQDNSSLILAPTILGNEFPLGEQLPKVPISLEGAFEIVKHGIIHTDLVRSLMGRWENRSRYKLPK